MANTTAKGAVSIHGTNPQFLIDKVLRSRIYDSEYWKESCFGLTAETIIDKTVFDLNYLGSTFTANLRPTPFICLLLKLLQLQPEKEIILEYLRAEEFKYLRALAAFYVRLTFTSINVYQTLEPLLQDYRKLRVRGLDGTYDLTTFDELIDNLLTESIVFEIVLPRLTSRKVLEDLESLPERKSTLGIALGFHSDDSEQEQDQEEGEDRASPTSDHNSNRFVSRSPTPTKTDQDTDNPDQPHHSPTARSQSDRFISRSPSLDRFVSRSPTPEPERVEGDL
ncbi:hypothetical protein MJO28_007596 [Puccinia striiformis f. sp. tritici]|uniref:Pre-mRNA-splicing factor 38 n=2 Tax=Puccinia striiformis TaxID=27350 RepID=A0A2S4VIR1_9BASI|nr:hypothetical protein Pst134EA_013707 [Puccinia striiformis f. sp. tritici]KAH9465842.1 hypothetical protein Pst134EA_013707 [Puccinia striiformis f. sp. tritici]KAI7951912.1 hypothetical protein MJO28_007596 [Puccinia striiformis f. sp. tritici]POW09431.1 hypothetical protein PSTT_06804 [Puccinia striiformis]